MKFSFFLLLISWTSLSFSYAAEEGKYDLKYDVNHCSIRHGDTTAGLGETTTGKGPKISGLFVSKDERTYVQYSGNGNKDAASEIQINALDSSGKRFFNETGKSIFLDRKEFTNIVSVGLSSNGKKLIIAYEDQAARPQLAAFDIDKLKHQSILQLKNKLELTPIAKASDDCSQSTNTGPRTFKPTVEPSDLEKHINSSSTVGK